MQTGILKKTRKRFHFKLLYGSIITIILSALAFCYDEPHDC